MITRLLRRQSVDTNAKDLLASQLRDIGVESSSPIAAHYKATFGIVDTFDTYLGHIPWEYKCEKFHKIVVIHCLRMCVVNAAHIYQELCYSLDKRENELDLKHFVSAVSDALLAK